MVLPSLLASPSTATSSPTSRMRRGGGRGGGGGGGGGTVIIPPSRPPVLLQINDTTILAGTVTDASPKRIFPYQIKKAEIMQSAEASYRFWAPLLQQVYDNLGQDTKDRRAVVLVPDATVEPDYIRMTLKDSILRVLSEVIGVPSVSIQPALPFLPYAFPMLSTMIVVHVSAVDASCFVHSKDRSLPFTFQSVPLETMTTANGHVITNEWTNAMDRQYLDAYYPQSVMFALLKTLEACPLPIRGQAIQNIVFCGEGVVYRPDLPLRMVKRLKLLLEQGKFAPDDDDDEQQQPVQEPGPYPVVLGMVPVAMSSLKALAPLVGLVDTVGTLGTCRADMLAWMGATLWASHSHQHNPDAFLWISKNEEEPSVK